MIPEIVEFSATRIAVLEHQGPPQTLSSSVSRFIEWRMATTDSPERSSRTFGIAYNNPQTTPPEQFRFDICGELSAPLQPNNAGVIEKWLPQGRCARVRHVGSTDRIGETLHPLYAHWLPQSGEKLREFPVFFHYIERIPKVQEHEQITDVYLPLR